MAIKMNLYTTVHIPALPPLSHQDQVWLMGSCFVSEMGMRLQQAKFKADVNPYGVLYNPFSIARALKEIVRHKVYRKEDLYCYRGLWHSAMHHGDFSKETPEATLMAINERIDQAHGEWPQLKTFFITWGTAWVYQEVQSGEIVGNCHQLPERDFTRRRLSVAEIVDSYKALITDALTANAQLQLVFTVSPIRHIRDGLHDNQLSKSTLLLAIDELVHLFPEHVSYFPAYELLIDELRDYRFYADDLVHPSAVAIDYIWQQLVAATMSKETRELMEQCLALARDLAHRPLHPQSEGYKRFLEQILLKIEQLREKYLYLELENERNLCLTRLKTLQK